MASEKGSLLARSDFPLYVVKALDERHFLVAGGGGAAKTGVSNAIEVYEIKPLERKVLASSICRHDVGDQAIMNGCSVYDGRNHLFAAGLDDECHVFSLKYRVTSPQKKSKEKEENSQVRKRKGETEESKEKEESVTKQILFDIEKVNSKRTDFHKDGSFQKVVQFSPDRTFLATGGCDDFLRVWKFPEMEKTFEIHAHKNDIDDIDISPDCEHIVTVSRDRFGYVWKAKDGKKHTDLNGPEDYRFRACRYGLVEGKKEKFNLYTISIPLKRAQKPQACYLTMWDNKTFKSKGNQTTGTEVLSSLAVSDDGVYVAVGTISGSVAVYISFSLQKLYYVKEAHSIFVTGLAFMPSSQAALAVTGNQDFTLMSISVDNTIRVHQVAPRTSYNFLIVIAGVIIIILLIFYVMATYGI